jgi:hypothetical protein
MNQLRTCACVLGALLLTGGTAARAAGYPAGAGARNATGRALAGTARASGHVTGRLLIEGGPIGPGGQQPGERPVPGTVTFTGARHRPVAVGVGTAGNFSAWLPPGRYQVAGRSPDIISVTASGNYVEQTCSQPLSVTVTARHAATIAVVCAVP